MRARLAVLALLACACVDFNQLASKLPERPAGSDAGAGLATTGGGAGGGATGGGYGGGSGGGAGGRGGAEDAGTPGDLAWVAKWAEPNQAFTPAAVRTLQTEVVTLDGGVVYVVAASRHLLATEVLGRLTVLDGSGLDAGGVILHAFASVGSITARPRSLLADGRSVIVFEENIAIRDAGVQTLDAGLVRSFNLPGLDAGAAFGVPLGFRPVEFAAAPAVVVPTSFASAPVGVGVLSFAPSGTSTSLTGTVYGFDGQVLRTSFAACTNTSSNTLSAEQTVLPGGRVFVTLFAPAGCTEYSGSAGAQLVGLLPELDGGMTAKPLSLPATPTRGLVISGEQPPWFVEADTASGTWAGRFDTAAFDLSGSGQVWVGPVLVGGASRPDGDLYLLGTPPLSGSNVQVLENDGRLSTVSMPPGSFIVTRVRASLGAAPMAVWSHVYQPAAGTLSATGIAYGGGQLVVLGGCANSGGRDAFCSGDASGSNAFEISIVP